MVDSLAKIGKPTKDEEEQAINLQHVPYVPPHTPVQFSDNFEACEKVDAVHKNQQKRPEVDKPLPIDEKEYKKTLDELHKLTDNLEADEMLHELVLKVAADTTTYLRVQQERLHLERGWQKSVQDERFKAFDAHFAKMQTAMSWNKVSQSLTSFGLLASGIASLALGVSTLGVGAAVIGGLLVIDQLLDNVMKTTVASWLARKDTEKQEVWLNRIQIFCALVSTALSFGLNASQAVQIAMKVASTAVTATKGIVDWRVNTHRALIIELDAACRDSEKDIDERIRFMQYVIDAIHQSYDNVHHIDLAKSRVVRELLRPVEAY